MRRDHAVRLDTRSQIDVRVRGDTVGLSPWPAASRELAQRLAFFLSRRPGSRESIRWAVRQVPGVGTVAVLESLRTHTVYVLANGPSHARSEAIAAAEGAAACGILVRFLWGPNA